jgi:hypothetical protein
MLLISVGEGPRNSVGGLTRFGVFAYPFQCRTDEFSAAGPSEVTWTIWDVLTKSKLLAGRPILPPFQRVERTAYDGLQ